MRTPPPLVMVPVGLASVCSATRKSGTGTPWVEYRPSATIARAPAMSSSAGWQTSTSVPPQAAGSPTRAAAMPSIQVTWASWPHMWATGTSTPSARTTRTLLR